MPRSPKTSTSNRRAGGRPAGPPAPPVLGICGYSGSGKTTLLVRLLPALKAAGLRVAVVKHDAHALDVDKPGKDSDRLFRAGADVLVHDPRQALLRLHARRLSLPSALARLGGGYDLILVEGHKRSSGPKIWLLNEGETMPPPRLPGLLAVLPRTAARPTLARRLILQWLGRSR